MPPAWRLNLVADCPGKGMEAVMGNDVPIFWMLDPGFLSFLAVGAVVYGVWLAVQRLR